MDISNQLASASRFGWVTLQAHGCMESYLKDRFRRHPGINSSFICFLMRHMADQTSLGLKEAVNALTTRVKKVKEAVGGKVTQEMYYRLDAKIEAIINANDLKRRKRPISMPTLDVASPKVVYLLPSTTPQVVVQQMICPFDCSTKVVVVAEAWPCWLSCLLAVNVRVHAAFVTREIATVFPHQRHWLSLLSDLLPNT